MNTLPHHDAAAVAAALDSHRLIEALRTAFARESAAPPRAQHRLDAAGARILLTMPAWNRDAIGVKLVTVFPENPARGLAAVSACYVLFDAGNGTVRATLDGKELTLRRTAAASALASQYLSRTDSGRLLMVGTGDLAPHLIQSHASVRPIGQVRIWGRTAEHARALAQRLGGGAWQVEATTDLAGAVAWADIISCATLATSPLVPGAWLRAGQHLDLVGAFTPHMREADDEAVRRAEVFVDTREGALAESGELIQAIDRGSITREHIRADLHELARGLHAGRQDPAAITLFKSVGHALEDLAAAQLVVDRAG